MSLAHNPGTCIAFRTSQMKRPHPAVSGPRILHQFERRSGLTEPDISPGEYRELMVFDEFLTHHVRPDGLRDVQCMLLWNEWVRTCRRQTHGFPKLVLENEFRNAITNQLGVGIAHDNYRGAVYPGIRFVP